MTDNSAGTTQEGRLGDLLREAREEKGLSIPELEEVTKIRRNQLDALERSEYGKLPPPVFLRGLLRNLAGHLDLDNEEILERYRQEVPHASGPPPVELTSEPLVPTSLQIINWLLIALLIAAVGFMAYWVYQQELWERVLPVIMPATPTVAPLVLNPRLSPTPTGTPSPVPTATSEPTDTPVPTATLSPTRRPTRTATSTPVPEVSARELRLSVEATERVWLRVSIDGDQAFVGTLEEGATRSWTASERIEVRSGNAGGTQLTINDATPFILGESGQVVERLWMLDRDGAVVTVTPQPTPTPGG